MGCNFVGLAVTDGTRSFATEPLRRQPTIGDLMRHTAGFTYGPFGSSFVQQAYTRANVADYNQTNAELLTKLAALPPAYQPGTCLAVWSKWFRECHWPIS